MNYSLLFLGKSKVSGEKYSMNPFESIDTIISNTELYFF